MSKKKAATGGSVNVDAIKRDVKKMVDNYDPKPAKNNFGDKSFGEIAPGTVKRESPLEQSMGTQRYREMIHDHNKKNADIHEKFPFTFPKKRPIRSHLNVVVYCTGCGEPNWGTELTIGMICEGCKKYNRVENAEARRRGYDPENNIGYRGKASDQLGTEED